MFSRERERGSVMGFLLKPLAVFGIVVIGAEFVESFDTSKVNIDNFLIALENPSREAGDLMDGIFVGGLKFRDKVNNYIHSEVQPSLGDLKNSIMDNATEHFNPYEYKDPNGNSLYTNPNDWELFQDRVN